MRADYAPALKPRGTGLRCGRTDCRYYASRTDSCDYLLLCFEPRGCPPAPDCSRYLPRASQRVELSERTAARVQAALDMGRSLRQIARGMRVDEQALRRSWEEGLKKTEEERNALDLLRPPR